MDLSQPLLMQPHAPLIHEVVYRHSILKRTISQRRGDPRILDIMAYICYTYKSK